MNRVDHAELFRREVAAFETAARAATGLAQAPPVPSCPNWSVTDLIAHLGQVHRGVALVVRERMSTPPDIRDESIYHLPADHNGWPAPGAAGPTPGPVPVGIVDWFVQGAAELARLLADRDPADVAWTWWTDHTMGFWARMQTIEAALHRWDAQAALGVARPIDAELATDIVLQTFQVMAPFRRQVHEAPPGAGETFRFRRTDGRDTWTVVFDGAEVRLADGRPDVEIAGSASDLALFVWRRIPADRLAVRGDRDVLDRYFTLVPPV